MEESKPICWGAPRYRRTDPDPGCRAARDLAGATWVVASANAVGEAHAADIGLDIQADEQGSETSALRRQWQAIMSRRAEGASAEAAVSGLPPVAVGEGMRLLKFWAGETHEVIGMDKGVVWNGTTFSLSAVARSVTGTPRNGPKFFGLREKK